MNQNHEENYLIEAVKCSNNVTAAVIVCRRQSPNMLFQNDIRYQERLIAATLVNSEAQKTNYMNCIHMKK